MDTHIYLLQIFIEIYLLKYNSLCRTILISTGYIEINIYIY